MGAGALHPSVWGSLGPNQKHLRGLPSRLFTAGPSSAQQPLQLHREKAALPRVKTEMRFPGGSRGPQLPPRPPPTPRDAAVMERLGI